MLWPFLFIPLTFIVYRLIHRVLTRNRRGPDDALSSLKEDGVFTTISLPPDDLMTLPGEDWSTALPAPAPTYSLAFARFVMDYQDLTGHAAALSCLLSLYRHYRAWHSQEETRKAE